MMNFRRTAYLTEIRFLGDRQAEKRKVLQRFNGDSRKK